MNIAGERLTLLYPIRYNKCVIEYEAQGKAEGGRNVVLTVLQRRFKMVLKKVEKSILGMSDPIALES